MEKVIIPEKKQIDQIKLHLQTGRPLTPIDALNLYGCFRLSAVVYTLKNGKDGHAAMNIEKDIIYNGRKRYAKYFVCFK
jgi:hypothetical protein